MVVVAECKEVEVDIGVVVDVVVDIFGWSLVGIVSVKFVCQNHFYRMYQVLLGIY